MVETGNFKIGMQTDHQGCAVTDVYSIAELSLAVSAKCLLMMSDES